MKELHIGSDAPEPAIIVIFGITGDLAQRKLLPALYHLIKDGSLHPKTRIVGITRRDVTAKELLGGVELCVLEKDNVCDPAALKVMHQSLEMHQMDLNNADDYDHLSDLLKSIEDQHGNCMNRLYYLSVPPPAFRSIVKLLGERGLNKTCHHGVAGIRLLVEKPFGYDLESAEQLIKETNEHFDEDQIFRIDHYLAKETVQNILMFRFANPLFNTLWDHKTVESVTITASEVIGIENRITFYEQTGALRDLIQSHLLQLMTLVTMELPPLLESQQIHHNKLDLLNQVEAVPAELVTQRAIRGQYDGYKKQVSNESSTTETFASLELYINNPRWQGVPVYLTTGKALRHKRTDIRIKFHADTNGEHNTLTFRIQPAEGIELELQVKKPGFAQATESVLMDFSYNKSFDSHLHPDAYERVLVDAVKGDHTLFATADEVLASWKIVQPVIEAWSKKSDDLKSYVFGSDGPTVRNS